MGRRCPNCGHKNEVAWKFCSNCAFKNTEEIASCSYHFVVLGSGGVGKSCIVIQFVNGIFEPRYDPTIEDRYQKVIEYKGVPCLLEILDTAGQETFSAMRELYMTDGQGFVLVYSITSRKSIEDLVGIRESILTHKNSDNVPMVLVGNKSDLVKKREIENAEGKEYAAQFGCPFTEASAKKNLNISYLFQLLIQQVWELVGKPKPAKQPKGCVLL
eukprot:TRINITY_DN5643_c0_g1_i1.p1 TRINITY_DN5643_c0_g1~~TRINITY_DN5643_c0_g1_i1.p1  ORF type:complete len:240 (-),score=39.77 TRINITY_DN5643_c0_g1_i1:100-744(-)